MRFHPSGELIASADEHGEIRLWSLTGGASPPARTLQGQRGDDVASVRRIRARGLPPPGMTRPSESGIWTGRRTPIRSCSDREMSFR